MSERETPSQEALNNMSHQEQLRLGYRVEASGLTWSGIQKLRQALFQEGIEAYFGNQCLICHASVNQVRKIAEANGIKPSSAKIVKM